MNGLHSYNKEVLVFECGEFSYAEVGCSKWNESDVFQAVWRFNRRHGGWCSSVGIHIPWIQHSPLHKNNKLKHCGLQHCDMLAFHRNKLRQKYGILNQPYVLNVFSFLIILYLSRDENRCTSTREGRQVFLKTLFGDHKVVFIIG